MNNEGHSTWIYTVTTRYNQRSPHLYATGHLRTHRNLMEYFRINVSIPCLLKPWPLASTWGQQPWHQLYELTTTRSVLEWLVLLSGKARVVPAVAQPLAAGTTSAVPDSSTNHDSTDRVSGQFLFYRDHHFIKSEENLRFRRLVPLFVPIGICVTMHGDGATSDVIIGTWRHNK